MDDLTPRQKEILTRIIESYIATTQPIGSRTLARRYDLGLSPASLRHEMGILEELGFLTHPHTSAGRVPTDRGYRFYVREGVREEPVSQALLDFIARQMEGKIENLEGLMARASRVLSAMAEEAVLVMSPELKELLLKELSLVALDPTRLLAVWCTTSGLVQNCLVEMDSPVPSAEVERIRNFINEELAGEPIDTLEDVLLNKMESRCDSLRQVYERTLQIIRRSIPHWGVPQVFVEGSCYILNQPEFQDVRKFRPLIARLEEKSSWVDLLRHQSLAEGVHVAIGEKELSKDIWDCALVSATYLWRGKCVGMLGILGPRRMPYGRMMGLAHQMAGEMSQALDRWGS
jgi:heat-inducible transcriptional repressor